MEFQKIKEEQYLVQLDNYTLEKINNIIKDLSNEQYHLYDDVANEILFNKILTRIVTSNFIKQGLLNSNYGFTSILCNIDNKTITISVGAINLNNNIKYLEGTLDG